MQHVHTDPQQCFDVESKSEGYYVTQIVADQKILKTLVLFETETP